MNTSPDRIRTLRADEIDRVIPLFAAQFVEHEIHLETSALIAVRGLLAEPSRGAILVAERDGALIGLAQLAYTWTLEHGGLVAWLDELFVLPAARGCGVGGMLLERAIQHARDAGCRALELEVDASHQRVERLYEHAGFTRLRRQRFSMELATARAD